MDADHTMTEELRTRDQIWRPSLTPSMGLGLVLLALVILTGMRAAATLGSMRFLAPASFILMAATPWIFLDREGRRRIGLVGAHRASNYWTALGLGALAAAACFLIGLVLFSDGADNWFVSVASDYAEVPGSERFPNLVLHAIFTIPALIFSPIGEEIFFRGVLMSAFAEQVSLRLAMILQAAAFGLVHILYHGLAVADGAVSIRPVSGLLWVALMFAVALLFAEIRVRSGSLFPAMVSHSAFNLMMNLTIFGFLWPV